ncbi:MAG: hypothetical protein AAF914_15370, partial [Pseudomonadota bacterium]
MRGLLLPVCAAMVGVSAKAQDLVGVELAGQAALPAISFSEPPSDAPDGLRLSGRFLSAVDRTDVPGSGGEFNGLRLPFMGQPLQGFSGYAGARTQDGDLIALIDNG